MVRHAVADVEYAFPFGQSELEGIANRTDFDLRQHMQMSGKDLRYFDDQATTEESKRFLPHVIEPSAGLDRGVLALLCEAFTEDPSRPSPELLKFHPRLAPIKAAVYPLVNKDGMPEIAEKLYGELNARFGRQGFIEFDVKQNIGKRYARMDEAGCPYCFTIDGETAKDQSVTVRDRDTGSQERIGIDKVSDYLDQKLRG